MRGLAVAGLLVLAVVILFLAGIFGQLPGLMLAGFCVGPFAFMALGFAFSRSGVRIAVNRDTDPAPAYRPSRRPRGFAEDNL